MTSLALLPLLAGCAPLVVPWPPPAAFPTQVDPLDAREVSVAAAATPMFGATAGENLFQGTYAGQVGVGLGHDLSVSLTGSRHLLGPTGAIVVSWSPHHGDLLDAGALVSLGGSWSNGTYDRRIQDENGDTVYDEDGEPVVEEDVPYAYGSVAPGFGGQLSFHAGRSVSFPLLARVSYARTIWPDGTAGRDAGWLEVATGVRFSAGRHFALGLGPQLLVWEAGGTVLPLVTGAASVEVRLGGPKP